MENEQRKYWFFGSKLNTALLLILIILMVVAIRIMLQSKEVYLPVLKNEEPLTSVIQTTDNSKTSTSQNKFEELPPEKIFNFRSQTYSDVGITKEQLDQLITKNIGDCNPGESVCAKRTIDLGLATVSKKGFPDSINTTVVIITFDGMYDDSVMAQKMFVTLVQDVHSTEWNISPALATWRCAPGRGHQDFSADTCI